jgi:hypothetical protein
MTTATNQTPLPAGVESVGQWEPDVPMAYRILRGPRHNAPGVDDGVQATAIQWADGYIEKDGNDAPSMHLAVHTDIGLTAEQARGLAAAILECADELEGWTDDNPDDTGQGRTEAYQLRDVHRRIRNILDRFPASSWAAGGNRQPRF